MTIKEMEMLLDMPRANIRYYEQEGLISPERSANGYRNYTDADARTLERVRLLRALGCSVAEIRDIKEGRAALDGVMREKSASFAAEQAQAANAREICEAICMSGERFDDLDAEKYLTGAWQEPAPARPIELPQEMPPKASLWRRFWARMLDIEIYTGIWTAVLCFLWPASQLSDALGWDLLAIAAGDIIMLALEPLMLHFFGATPGKWILGLRVRADDGGRLSIPQAKSRTVGLLWHGMCLGLPVIEWRFWWKRYKEAEAGEPMCWEDESYIEQRGKIGLRVVGYIVMRIVIATALVCCMGLGRMPVHRGVLTPEEFAENYNRLTWAYGVDQAVELTEDGMWRERDEYVINVFGDELPMVEMETENGEVCAAVMRMRAEAGEEGNMVFLPVGTMQRIAVALCCAESPRWREMLPYGSDETAILRFFAALDPTGIDPQAAGDMQELLYADGLEIGAWEIRYAARTSGGVFGLSDSAAVVLPGGENGVFEMEFTVRRK